MRQSRLYLPLPLQPGQMVTLDDASAHYLRTVLRLKHDDAITVFNGQGIDYGGMLLEVSRKQVRIAIGIPVERNLESPLLVNLGLGIARGDRMDLAVQKAVELGVQTITPIFTERCVVQLKGEKQQQRVEHWRKIIQHACEQCGRNRLPELADAQPLTGWVEHQPGLKIFLDPHAENRLNALTPIHQTVSLLSGPEGGFTDQERCYAKAAGFIPVRLGARVLRAETAALAALAAVQTLWGDF
ncbi:MAG: 16S rRNA (uracil(1498)-N(3))-methyltransferase [Methylobacter sp.]|nr:MAG: 16S rRNA (uracil(1498)-N(3))-methyltransferase [Methylobacter sp.]PPD36120.1 MAG: 16S rRNA (uracil(1498)-N(3))-methyltransferase [Methylomonas sp.]